MEGMASTVPAQPDDFSPIYVGIGSTPELPGGDCRIFGRGLIIAPETALRVPEEGFRCYNREDGP